VGESTTLAASDESDGRARTSPLTQLEFEIAVADNLTVLPDKDDVTSEVLLFAFGLAAKLERTSINDRISAARDRLEAEGRPWGRPRRMTDELVARARSMYEEGRTRSGRSHRR
jgi:DNA invertase Pin-like site-specific DNA recombinase